MTELRLCPERSYWGKGNEKAPGHGVRAVSTRGRKLGITGYRREMPGIEIFGGYLPVYHDRKGLTKTAGDCRDKKSPGD